MKNSQRKKIIIGYRYDPQSYTSQRLQQIQSIQEQFFDEYLPTDSVKKSFETDQKLIEKLKNENSLLKAELQRMEQKSSFRTYQQLSQQYKQLESQCNRLRCQVQELKNTIKMLQEQIQKERETQRQNKRIQTQIIDQERIQFRDGRKYTFFPYNNNFHSDDIQQSQKYSFQKLKSIQTNRNTTTDESIQNRFYYDTLPKQSQNFDDIQLNNSEENQQRQNYLDTYKNNTFNPAQFKFIGGIDSEYLYNDIKTIQSQKSQQLQSQIHLGYNFSFMPKPLIKNIKTLQALQEENDKKVNLKDENNITFTTSHKQMVKKEIQPPYFNNSCQQSLCVSQNNQSESNIGKLSGLRKLPNKPMRYQRTSNNSISISDN